jgi:hypothetical protein
MSSKSWTETELWKLLQRRGEPSSAIQHYLKSWLDEVELLLSKGGTAPLDFTLHDDEHSFRVAERMRKLIPEKTITRLSDFEIGLLLKSAYLHDIGMNPRRDIVSNVRDFILTGERGCLASVEATKLQRWLDENYPGVQPPVDPGKNTIERLRRAEFLTAYYCRHRHNDWSEQFIEQYASDIKNPPYPMWISDLTNLCKSHHIGLHGLLEDQFNLRIVGSENKLVNLRYLAAVLRVADVLEFDPERTPTVIFEHRAIIRSSRIYWYKDHDIVLGFNDQTRKILITARTSDAWTHRAVIQTADDIDHELQTCAVLNDQGEFLRGVRLDGADYYDWPWPRNVARDILPRPNSFEYIDGAFRPDAQRIISLLAGTELYHSPLVALRELVQNAFDSVREQIALELLQERDPSNHQTQQNHARLHKIILSVEARGEELWLLCSDTGVGMTRKVVEQYLLVSGSRPRPELLELERQCSSKGFKFKRTGQFGIGVLSYFMLGDKLVIETRSSQEAYREQEAHGWRFETEGVDAFGELRSLERTQRGTLVSLRIRSEKIADFEDEADDYLTYVLANSPCAVELRIGPERFISEGWAKTSGEVLERVIPAFRDNSYESDRSPKSNREKEEHERKREQWKHVKQQVKADLRLFGPMLGRFENDVGSFRIFLPYFDLGGEASFFYFNRQQNDLVPFPDNTILAHATAVTSESWRGFCTSGGQHSMYWHDYLDNSVEEPVSFFIEKDLTDGGSISVDRESLSVTDEEKIRVQLERACEKLLDEFFERNEPSKYCALLPEWIEHFGADQHEFQRYWLFPKADPKLDLFSWREIKFPAILVPKEKPSVELFTEDILFANGLLDELRPLKQRSTGLLWPLHGIAPNRLIFRNYFQPCLVYENADLRAIDDRVSVKFPDEWRDFLVITADPINIYNSNHTIFQSVRPDDWLEVQQLLLEKDNRLEVIKEVALSRRHLSCAWLLAMSNQGANVWEALKDNAGEEFATILASANCASSGFSVWKSESNAGVRTITLGGCAFLEGVSSLPKLDLTHWQLAAPMRK